ncbi:MAG: hypothetical protein U0168_23170 [Nannocystaceae bacterium]
MSNPLRTPLSRLALVGAAALSLTSGCAFESIATANRVPTPVLVGPVEQIGGGATVDRTDGPEFDIKVDRTVTASSSSQTSGNVTVTTTSASSLVTGAGVVDAKMRLAAGGAKDRLIHVDRVRVNSYSGFFYSAAWISSRVRLKGHVGRGVTMPSAAAAPAPADATATSTPTAANP